MLLLNYWEQFLPECFELVGVYEGLKQIYQTVVSFRSRDEMRPDWQQLTYSYHQTIQSGWGERRVCESRLTCITKKCDGLVRVGRFYLYRRNSFWWADTQKLAVSIDFPLQQLKLYWALLWWNRVQFCLSIFFTNILSHTGFPWVSELLTFSTIEPCKWPLTRAISAVTVRF